MNRPKSKIIAKAKAKVAFKDLKAKKNPKGGDDESPKEERSFLKFAKVP